MIKKSLGMGAFAILTKHGTLSATDSVGDWESAGERGRYKQEAAHFARRFAGYLRHNGRDLLYFLGKNPDRYLRRHLKGVGAGRIDIEHALGATYPKEGYILVNGKGDAFTHGIESMVKYFGLTRSEAGEYFHAHELTHLAGELTEYGVDRKLYRYFMHRAMKTKDPEAKARYMRLAKFATARYQAYKAAKGRSRHMKVKEKQQQPKERTDGKQAPKKQYQSGGKVIKYNSQKANSNYSANKGNYNRKAA